MKSFKADYVFPVCADPIKNGIVTVDDFGKITAVIDPSLLPGTFNEPVEQVSGIICPGFVNTHCHLELSHMSKKIGQHTGLVNFIKEVQKSRGAEISQVNDAILQADSEMHTNGIVAVGDISNTNITIPVKENSKLYYHSFIETFGFLPEKAEEVFNNALALLNEFKPLSCSVTPHAPYSVSKELFKLVQKYSETG
ncbi:MAG: amidohydrolase family protein, partial [Mucilaginibacter sp.]